MTAHPDDALLAELAQGQLHGATQEELEGHVEECSSCRSLLAQLLEALQPETQPGPRKGLVVGRYVVLEAVGAGAIGEVFAAYDTTLERTVALKWLFPSVHAAERKTQRTRLMEEARALARVQHPNVVSVYDVEAQGEHDVIVMELVRGQSLKARLRAKPPWREVVAAFADAGRGLAAAHAAGVIHRDFKPDNVLVDAAGRVRVADFGLARTGDRDAAFGAGAKVSTLSGTPAYLAPERWTGAIADAASDQFSFCASLYECLAGRLPFTQQEVTARLTEMRAGPPPLSGVPSAVEQAVRRGLAFDTAARWPSMEALVGVLDRSLEPSRVRSRAVLGVSLAVIAAVPAYAWRQSVSRCRDAGAEVERVWSPTRAEAVRAAFTKTKQPSAAALADRVLERLDRAAHEISALRVSACEATAFHGESDGVLALRNACLQRRADDLGALAAIFETADERTVERAVGAVESLPAANECMSAARALAEPAPGGEAGRRVGALAPQVSQVRALRLAGKPRDSLALGEKLVPDVRAIGWRPLVSELLSENASGLERAGRFDESRKLYLEAFQLGVAANDLPKAYAAAVGLAGADGSAGRTDSAYAWVAVAKALIEPAGLRGTPEGLRIVNAEGLIQLRGGRFDEAAVTFGALEKGLDALGQLRTFNGARALQNLGSVMREGGHPVEGLAVLERSLAIMEQVLAPSHPDVAAAYNNLGSALADLKRYDEAETFYRRCITLREQLYGPEGAPLATPHYNLGELAFRKGDGATALLEYGKSRALVEKARGADDDDAWDSRMGEGLALGLLGRHAEAVAALEAVLPQIEKRKLPAWNIAQTKLGLAASLKALGKEPARVTALAKEIAGLQGERHEAQRAQAEALLR